MKKKRLSLVDKSVLKARKIVCESRRYNVPSDSLWRNSILAAEKLLLSTIPQSLDSSSIDPVLLCEIEDLELSTRPNRLLYFEGIRYVRELVQRTENELRKIEGMGAFSVREIRNVLALHGLSLGTRFPSTAIDNWLDGEYDKRYKERKEEWYRIESEKWAKSESMKD